MPFKAAVSALAEYSLRLRADMKSWTGALWIPHDFSPSERAQNVGSVRDAIAAELTRMYYLDGEELPDEKKKERDDIPLSGLWLVTHDQMQQLKAFVELKETFKKVTVGLRGTDKRYDLHAKIAGDAELSAALKRAGLSRINTRVCYRLPRIIETPLISIRWNHGSHRHVNPILMKDLRKRLATDEDSMARRVEEAFAEVPDHHYVAETYEGTRLVANVVYSDKKRKTLPCSGVIFYESDSFPPSIGWNGAEAAKIPRKRKSDAIVDDSKPLHKSHIHRYLIQPVRKQNDEHTED